MNLYILGTKWDEEFESLEESYSVSSREKTVHSINKSATGTFKIDIKKQFEKRQKQIVTRFEMKLQKKLLCRAPAQSQLNWQQIDLHKQININTTSTDKISITRKASTNYL